MASKLLDMILPDSPLMLEAVAAMRQYHEAQASGCEKIEIERLRVVAEFYFQAIADHNLRVLGHPTTSEQ